MIELKNVSKTIKNKQILKNVSFKVPARKTFALLGQSGSGKTTLLKIACGLMSASSGQVLVTGENPRNFKPYELAQRIGYVIQEGGLFPHMKGKENVTLGVKALGWDQNTIETRLAELVELTELEESVLLRYPQELSGGQKQRLGIMRALMMDPPILLFDEPLSALDPVIRSGLRRELKKLFKKMSKTVLVVTHDIFTAGLLADEIVLLDNGVVIQQGILKQFLENPVNSFVSDFFQEQKLAHLE